MKKLYPRTLIGPIVALGIWALAMLSAQASTLLVGENYLGGGQNVSTDLAAYGGQVFSTYYQSPLQDGEPQRMRLIRYRNVQPRTVLCEGVQSPYLDVWGTAYCPSQVQAGVAAMQSHGLWWAMGNEVNRGGQDAGLTNDADGTDYARWFHVITGAIRAGDPTARILGPSVVYWNVGSTPGRVAYDRLWSKHQQLYGTAPVMTALNLHYYPQSFVLDGNADAQLAGEVGQAADYAQSHGVGMAVTEWSYWAQQFDANCTVIGNSPAARYSYVRNGLQTMAARGVQFALFFGNIQQTCDDNGHAAYLFNADGSLTVEGQAHHDFVYGVPTLTPTILLTFTATPALTATQTLTPTLTRPVCIPSYIRRCPSPTLTPTACIPSPFQGCP